MTLPQDLLDPKHYAGTRRPVEEASTLPPWAYYSPRFYEAERERIFLRAWNFVGHGGRIPNSGDYAAFDLAGVPLILVRGRDGKPRAFANSCRHRGAEMVQGEGRCNGFACPYHGWAYGLDGALRGAPGMERTADFDKADWGLKPIRLETMGAYMFVNFDPDAAPLSDWLGDLPELLAPYALDDTVLVRRTEYDVACNWKVYVENFMDYYHTPTVHKTTLAATDLSAYHQNPPDTWIGKGEYLTLYAEHKGSAALLRGATGFPEMKTLTGPSAVGSTYVCAFPNALMAHTKDCLWYVEIHPTGPATMRLGVGAVFPRETAERPDFEEVVQQYYERWDVSVDEDNRINEQQQRGVSSPLAEAGRVSVMETASHLHRNWVLDRVVGN
ncbi:MAG: aromatic ring-hydroxylating dioxygenase subunit alpha [Rhodospirillaceae bacterium]|jgi:choline monooxygenase|nr:aromatic ring-hydroxylating dioxygenase subunit alpha [Rhodospirillaceae bacterium]MBT6116433.1 aromatic ring-hydroxylating dioxygenase subunit alpha [Rhodospirillaceae bacterium]